MERRKGQTSLRSDAHMVVSIIWLIRVMCYLAMTVEGLVAPKMSIHS